MTDPTPLLNPALTQDLLIKKIIFFGGYINHFIVSLIGKLNIFDETQSSILVSIIYLLLAYGVIKIGAETMKPIIKIIIVILLAYLLIGFFG